MLLAHAEDDGSARLAFGDGAYHRRRYPRKSSPGPAARSASGNRTRIVARSADFFLSRWPGKARTRRIAANIQHGRGNDSRRAGRKSSSHRNRTEAPPRKILSDRPNPPVRSAQAASRLHRQIANLGATHVAPPGGDRKSVV